MTLKVAKNCRKMTQKYPENIFKKAGKCPEKVPRMSEKSPQNDPKMKVFRKKKFFCSKNLKSNSLCYSQKCAEKACPSRISIGCFVLTPTSKNKQVF